MGLETVTHIGDLSITDPVPNDARAQGDDHIRNIKRALKADLVVEHEINGANAGTHKFKSGATSTRPTAGVAGRPYFNTETLGLERDDGGQYLPVISPPRFAVDTSGAANTITLALVPATPIVSYNQVIYVQVGNTNTGAVSVVVDSFGGLPLYKWADGAQGVLEAGDIRAGQIIALRYSSNVTAHFELLTPVANSIKLDRITKLDGLKARAKDWGTITSNLTLNFSDADLHTVTIGANVTITLASAFTEDKALIVVKNLSNYTTTIAGVDNDVPTMTVGTNIQDFLGVVKSFNRITVVGTKKNRSAG